MNGPTFHRHRLLALLAVGSAFIHSASVARADLIAGDSFVLGDSGYKPGNLTAQPAAGTAPNSFGFSGFYGNNPTSFLQPDAKSLRSMAIGYKGATGGSIRMVSSENADGASRSLTRAIEKSSANPAIMYFSGLLQSPKALGADRGGFFEFGNRNQPMSSPSFLGEGASHKGFEVGISGTSFSVTTAGGRKRETYSSSYAPLAGVDNTATNLFVARLEIKPSGNDLLIIYLNPKDVSSEEKARETAAVALEFADRDVATHPSDISHFGFRTRSTSADATPIYGDEVRMGTTFESVVGAVAGGPQ